MIEPDPVHPDLDLEIGSSLDHLQAASHQPRQTILACSRQKALYFLAAILVISILLNKTPLFLLSGIGALTAVMMLVFKDAILGFVAGIQLAANKMVSVGDWC